MRHKGAACCLLTCACLLLGQGPAQAQNCDNPASDQDLAECAGLRLRAAERDMAVLLDKLEQSDDKELVEALRGSQQAWTAWREAEGKLAAVGARDPLLKLYARKKQEAQMTEDRVKDLKSLAE
ncbi:MAG: lysozyme inhibitor LprI family protein [Acidobacteriota bacterium]